MPLSVPQASGLAPKVDPLLYEALRTIATQAVSAANLTSTSGPTLGGTGTSTAFTPGSVVYAGAGGVYAQDNAAFFFDAVNNRLGIGTNAPDSPLTVSANATTPPLPPPGTVVHTAGADTGGGRLTFDAFGGTPSLTLREADGTASSPSATTLDREIGNIAWFGYGTAYTTTGRAKISSFAAELWTGTAQGTYMVFFTTPKGTATQAERFRVTDAGSLYLAEGTATALTAQVGGTVFTQTANSTTTANTLTTLFGTGVGSLTLPANLLVAGRTIRIKMGGYVSAADVGAGTHTLTLLLGGVSVATGTSGATFTSVLNAGWTAEAAITCRTTGAPGTVIGTAQFLTEIATATPDGIIAAPTSSTTASVTTTGTLAVDLKFNNGLATGTITTTWASVEVLN